MPSAKRSGADRLGPGEATRRAVYPVQDYNRNALHGEQSLVFGERGPPEEDRLPEQSELGDPAP